MSSSSASSSSASDELPAAAAPSSVLAHPEYYEPLTREMERVRSQFDHWCRQQLKSLDNHKLNHVAEMKTGQGIYQNLKEKDDLLVNRLEEFRTTINAKQAELAGRESALERHLADLQSNIVQMKCEAQLHLDSAQSEFNKERSELEREDFERQDMMRDKERTVALYSEFLGLSIVRGEGNVLKFSFKYIDSARPDREFSFAVSLNERNEYMLRDCEPRIAGVQTLIQELNISNEFGTFVRALRKRFKALVSTS